MPNKRSAPRLNAWWPVRIKQGRKTIEARTLNASNTGLLLLSPVRYRTGTKLEADIATSAMAFFRCTIYIVREKLRMNGQWLYGARFMNISPIDREILIRSLQALNRGNVLSVPELAPPPSPTESWADATPDTAPGTIPQAP
jgi:c-di-GMP-binding flagellar brake protein YcgR